MRLSLRPKQARTFKAYGHIIRAAVRDALETHLRFEPTKGSKSRIKRLRGIKRPQYRLRVDEVRVYYDVVEHAVEILAIVPKSEAQAWLAEKGERA
ncbi:MAG: type II toxin-antitoxin system RelE family toxin [Nitrospiraceae bacterium]